MAWIGSVKRSRVAVTIAAEAGPLLWGTVESYDDFEILRLLPSPGTGRGARTRQRAVSYFDTCPRRIRSPRASTLIFASCPSFTFTISVSSTFTGVMTDMSAIVINTVPG